MINIAKLGTCKNIMLVYMNYLLFRKWELPSFRSHNKFRETIPSSDFTMFGFSYRIKSIHNSFIKLYSKDRRDVGSTQMKTVSPISWRKVHLYIIPRGTTEITSFRRRNAG